MPANRHVIKTRHKGGVFLYGTCLQELRCKVLFLNDLSMNVPISHMRTKKGHVFLGGVGGWLKKAALSFFEKPSKQEFLPLKL